MSAISVLHAPRDEALGKKIAQALSHRGHAPRRLNGDPHTGDLGLSDDAAIIIWSSAATRLARLHQQAREALIRGALIPVAIGGAPAPEGFEGLAPVDLSGWSGDENDPRWRFVLEEIDLAAERQRLEDANVWADDASVQEGGAVNEDPPSPVVDPAAFDKAPAQMSLSAETSSLQKNRLEPAQLEAVNGCSPNDASPEPEEAHLSAPLREADRPTLSKSARPKPFLAALTSAFDRRFTPYKVFVSGGATIAIAASAAYFLAPTLVRAPEPSARTGGSNELAGSAAFVQPINDIRSSSSENLAANNAGAVKGAAISNEAADPQRLAEAIAEGAEADDTATGMAQTSGPSLAFDLPAPEERLEIDALTGHSLSDALIVGLGPAAEEQAPVSQDAIPASGEQETVLSEEALSDIETLDFDTEDANADDVDAIENLLAAIARGKEELELASAPAGATRGSEDAGDLFKDCAVCPEMARLPAGRFEMGAPLSELARREDEGPVRTVAIVRPFAIGAKEVTFSQWNACVVAGGCRGYQPADQKWGRGSRPVINVSYEDAKSYASWLSTITGRRYRLPSEAEWEYAARAGRGRPFGMAGPLTADVANYNAQYAYFGQKGMFRRRTMPTASFAPNAFGLYDMHGNVWEWTEDCWAPSHQGAPDDGAPRTEGADCSRRVLKGGAWNTGGWRLRAAHRIGKARGAREFDNGFRVVRELN